MRPAKSDLRGVNVISLAPASGWWVLERFGDDGGPWRRYPLAAFGLLVDGAGEATYVEGLEAGECVTIAREGRYVHDSRFRRCKCDAPDVDELDTMFCARCAGVTGEDVDGWR